MEETAIETMAASVGCDPMMEPRCPAAIEFGKWEIKTWYSSPFPQEYARLVFRAVKYLFQTSSLTKELTVTSIILKLDLNLKLKFYSFEFVFSGYQNYFYANFA